MCMESRCSTPEVRRLSVEDQTVNVLISFAGNTTLSLLSLFPSPLWHKSDHRSYVTSECGHGPMKSYLWTLRLEFHIVFTSQGILFLPPPSHLKNMKTTLRSWAVQNEAVGSVWPTGCSLLSMAGTTLSGTSILHVAGHRRAHTMETRHFSGKVNVPSQKGMCGLDHLWDWEQSCSRGLNRPSLHCTPEAPFPTWILKNLALGTLGYSPRELASWKGQIDLGSDRAGTASSAPWAWAGHSDPLKLVCLHLKIRMVLYSGVMFVAALHLVFWAR